MITKNLEISSEELFSAVAKTFESILFVPVDKLNANLEIENIDYTNSYYSSIDIEIENKYNLILEVVTSGILINNISKNIFKDLALVTIEDLFEIIAEIANTIAGDIVRKKSTNFKLSLPVTKHNNPIEIKDSIIIKESFIVDDTQLIDIQISEIVVS